MTKLDERSSLIEDTKTADEAAGQQIRYSIIWNNGSSKEIIEKDVPDIKEAKRLVKEYAIAYHGQENDFSILEVKGN